MAIIVREAVVWHDRNSLQEFQYLRSFCSVDIGALPDLNPTSSLPQYHITLVDEYGKP